MSSPALLGALLLVMLPLEVPFMCTFAHAHKYTILLFTLQEDVEEHSKLPNRRMADVQCPDSISISCPNHKLKSCF